MEIGNTIHNFEPVCEIQCVKAHEVADLGGAGQVKVSPDKIDVAITNGRLNFENLQA